MRTQKKNNVSNEIINNLFELLKMIRETVYREKFSESANYKFLNNLEKLVYSSAALLSLLNLTEEEQKKHKKNPINYFSQRYDWTKGSVCDFLRNEDFSDSEKYLSALCWYHETPFEKICQS